MDNDQATLNEPVEEVVEKSMDDTILETLNSIKEREAAAEPSAEVEAPTKTRAPDGKFAKAESTTPAAPGAENAVPTGEEQPAVQETPAANNAPASWKGTAKAKFATLDPEIQQEVLRRENDFHKGVEQYKQAATYGQAMHKALQPYENTIRQWGTTPDNAVRALFEADRKLSNGSPAEKAQAFAELAKGYGIDLSNGLQVPQVDPNTQYLQQRLQQSEARLQQLAAAHQQREQSEVNTLIEQAKQGKPHFDELSKDIGRILQSAIDQGKPITIDQAYEAALWQSPQHREALIAQQLEQKRAAEAEKAKAARAAASVNVSRRGTLAAQKPVGTMDDTIREAYARIRGGQ